LTLTAKVGVLEIVCDPPDAELYINGEARGRAKRVMRLAAVPQQIEIRKRGYESFAKTITPRPGFPQSIEVVLKTLEEVEAESRPPLISTPQGHEMRLVGPRRFRMGASRREPGRRANETIREVEITRPYYMAAREVSNRQFREFKKDHRSGMVGGFNLEIDHHPVVRVSWEEAAGYCNWLSEQESLPPAYVRRDGRLVSVDPPTTGYRLPTEAEWVGAARYPDGQNALKYPWGGALPVAPSSGNYADVSARGLVPATLSQYNDSHPVTAPVDSFEPNLLGLYSMGGNVAEWTNDYYTIYPTNRSEVERDPLGPAEGKFHVIRGSSWMHGSVTQLRLSYRDYGNEPRPDVGFRIARYAK
jgi:formylglycine-generating enzyme required for sulfatase activity